MSSLVENNEVGKYSHKGAIFALITNILIRIYSDSRPYSNKNISRRGRGIVFHPCLGNAQEPIESYAKELLPKLPSEWSFVSEERN